MTEEGDIFTDLLSGLMPNPAKPEINEEDNVEALVAKPASMNELRSSKHQGENGEMVDVKRSSSPIGVGLAPPPPPITKSEMEELMTELLRAKLFESMGALTGALRTCFQKVEGQLLALNEKCTEINSKVEEVACEQTKSSERMEKEMNAVLQSSKEAGVGLQRVLDKQELVDAHVQLSKYSKDNPDAREELRVQPKPDPATKVSAKGKDPGDTGGPSEPNPPSPVPMSAPQQKQEVHQPSQLPPAPPPVPHAAVQPVAAPAAPAPPAPAPPAPAPVPAQVGPPPPAPPPPRQQQGVMSPVVRTSVPPQASQLAYSEPTPSDHQIQQPYEAQHIPQGPPMDPQHQTVPQPTVPSPPSSQQPLPQGSFLQQAYPQPPQPPQTTPQGPPQGPPQPSRMQQSQAPMIPPPPGPQQMQWKPAPPQMPIQNSAYPPLPSSQYGQHQMQMPPSQPHFQSPVGGTGPPLPGGGAGYPQHPQGLSSRPPPGPPPQQPQAPPIYGAPPPMMSSHGSSGLQTGVSARTSNQSVPLEKVIDDVTSMGFDRTKVRSVVTDMINQGKAVDLNVVIDRLSSF